ncbi:hypothetical protein B0H14DRAFT_2342746 [Mycena olivaceomarginata]|nr:hypothetical protein B0H14DRAFT_2342746 [Mycena olivaceomarginata]
MEYGDFSLDTGWRAQYISDAISPCEMHWPDNEPFPESGQIRPGRSQCLQSTMP